MALASVLDGGSPEASSLGDASEDPSARSATHEVTANLSGKKGIEITFPATVETTCDLTYRAMLDPSDGASNNSGVLMLYDEGGEFSGWNRLLSLAAASAHVGEERATVSSPLSDHDGVYSPHAPLAVNPSDGLRINAVAHHWQGTEEEPSFRVQLDCDDAIPSPERVDTIDSFHYADERTARGGIGSALSLNRVSSINIQDNGEFAADEGPVEFRVGHLCLGSGWGTINVTGPGVSEEWPLGNDAVERLYRIVGEPGSWSYEVTHLEEEMPCLWWGLVWTSP